MIIFERLLVGWQEGRGAQGRQLVMDKPQELPQQSLARNTGVYSKISSNALVGDELRGIRRNFLTSKVTLPMTLREGSHPTYERLTGISID
jgi:hypothetical protein